MEKSICVVGAGLSGLAAVRALHLAGHGVECYEAGSALGGSWRYDNDNGVSAAYRSLHTNISRRNMRYGSLPIPGRPSQRVHHRDFLAYLERYAQVNRLAEHIRFGSRVQTARPTSDGAWRVQVDGEPERRFDALVVATGCLWRPNAPQLPGEFSGQMLHSRDYRTPEPFAGKRVLVLGAGQSALDIGAEISFGAARTVLAARQGHHLFPERMLGLPIDYFDTALLSRTPWSLARRFTQLALVSSPLAADRGELPMPSFSILEHRWPALATANIRRALSQQTLEPAPAVERLDGERVVFTDGREESFDAIVLATGYRIHFPFLADGLGTGGVGEFPLYRRIVSPSAENLAFVGILDAGPGRLQVTEAQAAWLAALLDERLRLPDREAMWQAIDACGEPRTRQRFGSAGAHTVMCDRHAYLRVLRGDLRRAGARRGAC
jgi:cation diffusion facilitator CzcD-associated flavoprotein CzcO